MNLPCIRCQTPFPASAAFCPACGLPRGQSLPGMPPPLPQPEQSSQNRALLGGVAPLGEGAQSLAPAANPAMPFGSQASAAAMPGMGAGPQAGAPYVPSAPAGPQGLPQAGAPAQGPVAYPPQAAHGWPGAQHPG